MTVRAEVLPGVTEAIAAFSDALATPRLQLRRLTADDTVPMFALFNDWEIIRWLSRPDWPQSFDVFHESLDRVDVEQASGQLLYLAIETEGQVVGGAAFTIADGLINLGYWIGQRYWGLGFMTEAAGAMCDWMFATTNELAIYSGVFEGNAASMRVQHKLGFVQIGTSMHYSNPCGRDLLHLDMKLTRTARRVALEKAHS